MHHNSPVRTTAVIDTTSSTTIVIEGDAPPPAPDQAIGPDEAHAGEPADNKADANEL